MHDTLTADRTALEAQRGTALPIWSPRRARSESDEGYAQRTTSRTAIADKDRGLSEQRRARSSGATSDPGHQLIEAILAYFGHELTSLIKSTHTPWASITFTGARHEIIIASLAEVEGLQLKLKSISDDIFALRGHILADIVVRTDPTAQGTKIIVEALTVESA
jgi:hypothetical protein